MGFYVDVWRWTEGKHEVNKVHDEMEFDIKKGIPEPVSFPSIKAFSCSARKHEFQNVTE
jgi:hypothetical protein